MDVGFYLVRVRSSSSRRKRRESIYGLIARYLHLLIYSSYLGSTCGDWFGYSDFFLSHTLFQYPGPKRKEKEDNRGGGMEMNGN